MMNDNGMRAPHLASSSPNLFKPDTTSQFNIIRDQKSIRMKDFLIKTRIPVTL